MKTLLIVASIASAVLSFAMPVRATTAVPVVSIDQLLSTSVDRRSHRCDTPAQIAANSICRKP